MEIRRIKKHIKHQGIGGKEIIIDENISSTLSPENVYDQAMIGNIACWNFIHRRHDFDYMLFEHKLYYGKVDGLGYIVAEDELEK